MADRNTYNQIILDAKGLHKPIMDDAYATAVNQGDEPDRPVFSDKEFPQYLKWDAQDFARQQYDSRPTPASSRAYTDASNAYTQSLNDPNLPVNRQNARMASAQTQGASDADIILKAMMERERLGRR